MNKVLNGPWKRVVGRSDSPRASRTEAVLQAVAVAAGVLLASFAAYVGLTAPGAPDPPDMFEVSEFSALGQGSYVPDKTIRTGVWSTRSKLGETCGYRTDSGVMGPGESFTTTPQELVIVVTSRFTKVEFVGPCRWTWSENR